MIVYDLRCPEGHQFEAWFRDSAAYEAQVEVGDVLCPTCGSDRVQKALMAPNLARGEARGPAAQVDERAVQARRALRALRSQIETNCDYVGARFPEEARRIHYGEADPRGIYGESTADEAEALKEEGVQVQRIPWLPRQNS
jgi:hypothetical protein